MSKEAQIRATLESRGIDDVLIWARERASVPLSELNAKLGAGVAPIDLENFMASVAREKGSYDDFVRVEACRSLNRYFPQGIGASKDPKFGASSGWAIWAGPPRATAQGSG
jgi:hypothetical protein